jgi:L-aminopeptidase/D-esterase-like protein
MGPSLGAGGGGGGGDAGEGEGGVGVASMACARSAQITRSPRTYAINVIARFMQRTYWHVARESARAVRG